jgi:hypothetical protein
MSFKTNCLLSIGFFIILVSIILYQIREDLSSYDPVLHKLKHKCRDVHPIIPKIELYEGNKSYTINKEKIYLCLKDKDGKYYNTNMLVYVFLHEVAHILCDEVGHTEKFARIFDELLEKASKLGVYDFNIPIIDDYCEY